MKKILPVLGVNHQSIKAISVNSCHRVIFLSARIRYTKSMKLRGDTVAVDLSIYYITLSQATCVKRFIGLIVTCQLAAVQHSSAVNTDELK